MIEVRFHGRGGQGTKIAGRILGRSGFLAGLYVQDFSLFGAERRGAPVVACTRLSRDPIDRRGYVEEPDVVVVMDESLLQEARAQIFHGVDAHTPVLINTAAEDPGSFGGDLPAAAWGARLAEADYVPAFPITPQTEIVETLARWIHAGEIPTRMVTMDSERSMLAAAAGAAATGVRVFTATSSQGLLYGFEMLYVLSGLRLPLVLVNVSRALAHPITLEPDHNDVLAARDCGFLQFHAETCQEVLDSILMAYRLAEHEKILLPAIVNLDGFYLSFTREGVDIPEIDEVRKFLPPCAPRYPTLSGPEPLALGAAVLDPSLYTFFKHRMHRGAENALSVYPEIAAEHGRAAGTTCEGSYCIAA